MNASSPLFFSFLTCGTLAAAGCHGDGSAADAGDSGLTGDASGIDVTVDADLSTAEGFCISYYQAIGDYENRCFSLTPRLWDRLMQQADQCRRIVGVVAAGRLAFNPASGPTCLAAIAAHDCLSSSDPAGLEACASAFAPLVQSGGACTSFYLMSPNECVGDAYCYQGGLANCSGTCKTRLAVGAECDPFADERCTSGSSCNLTSHTCEPNVAAAGPSGTCAGPTDIPCVDGYYCANGSSTAAGTCQPRKTTGACSSSRECVATEICVGASGAKSCSLPKQLNASCTPGNRECALLAYCTDQGRCSDAIATAGQPCTAGGEAIPCATGYYCDSTSVCQARKQPGESCTGEGGECSGWNGHCDSTTSKCASCP